MIISQKEKTKLTNGAHPTCGRQLIRLACVCVGGGGLVVWPTIASKNFFKSTAFSVFVQSNMNVCEKLPQCGLVSFCN